MRHNVTCNVLFMDTVTIVISKERCALFTVTDPTQILRPSVSLHVFQTNLSHLYFQQPRRQRVKPVIFAIFAPHKTLLLNSLF